MPSRLANLRLVYALGGLAMAGCCSPYSQAPYNPYGSGIPTYPQAVPMQPQFGPPVGSPTPVNPNGTFPPANNFGGSQFNDGFSPTPDPGASGTFPPADGGGNYDGFDPLPNSGSGLVPNNENYFDDPNTLSPPDGTYEGGGRAPFSSDGASFQPDTSSESVGSVRFERDTGTHELQLTAHQPASVEARPAVVSYPEMDVMAAKKPNPYGYDAVGYRWLRGLVDFDEQQKSWVLIYNPSPGSRDAYKGQITLIDNGQLRKLKNNDVVLVEGRIDADARDLGTGKPQYRVAKLYGPLIPKS